MARHFVFQTPLFFFFHDIHRKKIKRIYFTHVFLLGNAHAQGMLGPTQFETTINVQKEKLLPKGQ